MTAGLFTAKSGSVLHFDDVGSGPPVLALHGIGGGTYFFSGLAQRLAPRHRILSVDLPGTGKSSSAVQPMTLDSWIADLGDLVDEKIGEPVTILGHSLGTILALKAWATWPEPTTRIRALLFVCGLPQARAAIHEKLSARADAIARDGIGGWGPKVSPGVFSETSRRRHPEVVGLFERLFEEQAPASYVRSIEVLLAAELNAVVPTVTVPTAGVFGAEDLYAPPDAVEAFLARLPAPCRAEMLEACGHMPFFEYPEHFAEVVDAQLRHLRHPHHPHK
jgi:3-oxoadipate enol-lactonase